MNIKKLFLPLLLITMGTAKAIDPSRCKDKDILRAVDILSGMRSTSGSRSSSTFGSAESGIGAASPVFFEVSDIDGKIQKPVAQKRRRSVSEKKQNFVKRAAFVMSEKDASKLPDISNMCERMDSGKYQCIKCDWAGETGEIKSKISRHCLVEHALVIYGCSFCEDSVFTGIPSFMQHIKRIHGGDKEPVLETILPDGTILTSTRS